MGLYWDNGSYNIVYWGYIGGNYNIVYWGYTGIMEKKMETTIVDKFVIILY